MAGKKQLDPIDFETEAERHTVTWAAENGTRLDELKAVRNVLTRHIDNPKTLARDIASLTRQYQQISKEIEELEQLEKQYAEGTEGADSDSLEDAPFSAEAI